MTTHEHYISEVARLAMARLGDDDRSRLSTAKLVYGVGAVSGARGVTMFGRWGRDGQGCDLVEVCASGEESDVQLAGTTIHELGHVLAGYDAAHGNGWKDACAKLGLVVAMAAGQAYAPDHFEPVLWADIDRLEKPMDGKPTLRANLTPQPVNGQYAPLAPLPFKLGKGTCKVGIGAKGGKSRGVGSGSRLRLWVCECPKPVKVRVASDEFKAHCDTCHGAFKRA